MLYCLVNNNNEPFYVGRTRSGKSRLSQHASRFGKDIQMLDLEDSNDGNEQEWINYFLFMGANLENKHIKKNPRFDSENNIVIKIDKDKKEALSALARKQGITLSGIIRQTLYEKLKQE